MEENRSTKRKVKATEAKREYDDTRRKAKREKKTPRGRQRKEITEVSLEGEGVATMKDLVDVQCQKQGWKEGARTSCADDCASQPQEEHEGKVQEESGVRGSCTAQVEDATTARDRACSVPVPGGPSAASSSGAISDNMTQQDDTQRVEDAVCDTEIPPRRSHSESAALGDDETDFSDTGASSQRTKIMRKREVSPDGSMSDTSVLQAPTSANEPLKPTSIGGALTSDLKDYLVQAETIVVERASFDCDMVLLYQCTGLESNECPFVLATFEDCVQQLEREVDPRKFDRTAIFRLKFKETAENSRFLFACFLEAGKHSVYIVLNFSKSWSRNSSN